MSGIVIAPFSNSGIRDWPTTSYRGLIELLLDRIDPDLPVRLIGVVNQRLRANEIVRRFPAHRVVNACGRLTLAQSIAVLRSAVCLVGNNSGMVHLGGLFRVPTVCVFGGSHQRHEWRPAGPTVVVVSRSIGCSPCQLDHGNVSPYDKACLRQITPAVVADAVFTAIDRAGAVRAGGVPASRLPIGFPGTEGR